MLRAKSNSNRTMKKSFLKTIKIVRFIKSDTKLSISYYRNGSKIK